MNPVYFFHLLCLWLPFWCCSANAQYVKSFQAEVWRTEFEDFKSVSVGDSYNLEFWQPFGVSNLNCLELSWRHSTTNVFRSLSYSFLSFPGYRSHLVSGTVGLRFQDNIYFDQRLGIGLGECGWDQPAIYYLNIQNRLGLDLSESSTILMTLFSWPDLIWNDTDFLSPAGLQICVEQSIDKMARIGLGLRNVAGTDLQFLVFSQYSVSGDHDLFGGLSLNPIGFGLGYSYKKAGFIFRFLLEGGTLFGYSPFTEISWAQ